MDLFSELQWRGLVYDATEGVRESAAVGVVLVQDRGAGTTEARRERGDVAAVGGVAGDDAERPRGYPGERGRRRRGRNGREVAVVHLCGGDHRARVDVTDDGDDVLRIDEALGDTARHLTAALVVLEVDAERRAGPLGASVDLLERQLDPSAVHRAVSLLPRTRSAKGERAAGAARGGHQHGQEQKALHRR